MMKRLQFLIMILLVLIPQSVFGTQQRETLEREDTKAWERMVWVTGHIHILNHPELGRTPAAGEVIAFRQTDRSNHVVAVRANAEGKYEIFLDPGRYKIIVPGLNADRNGFVDNLASGQSRYIDVVRHPSGIRFNVELVLRK